MPNEDGARIARRVFDEVLTGGSEKSARARPHAADRGDTYAGLSQHRLADAANPAALMTRRREWPASLGLTGPLSSLRFGLYKISNNRSANDHAVRFSARFGTGHAA
jgi:hypothetical protein